MAPANPLRSIPNAGLQAPALGYGCMSLTGFFSEKPLSDSELDSAAKVLRRALDLGVSLFMSFSRRAHNFSPLLLDYWRLARMMRSGPDNTFFIKTKTVL